MYTKVVPYRRLGAALARSVYYLSREVERHKTLTRLERSFLGPGVASSYDLVRVAAAAQRAAVLRRGPKNTYAYFEVIISSPERAGLTASEVLTFAVAVVNGLRARAAMVGGHWHKDERVDFHVLVVNNSIDGQGLGRAGELLSTGRAYRNLEVRSRELVEATHVKMNVKRHHECRPYVPTMADVLKSDRLQHRRNCTHLSTLVRESNQWTKQHAALTDAAALVVQKLVGSVTDPTAQGVPLPPAVESVDAPDGTRNGGGSVEILPGVGASESRVSNPPSAAGEPAEASLGESDASQDAALGQRDGAVPDDLGLTMQSNPGRVKRNCTPKSATDDGSERQLPPINWEELVSLLFEMYTVDEDDDQKRTRLSSEAQRWFSDLHGFTLHDQIATRLDRDAKRGNTEAQDAQVYLRILHQQTLDRESNKGREMGLD